MPISQPSVACLGYYMKIRFPNISKHVPIYGCYGFLSPTVLVCMKWKCGYVVWSSWWSHSPARPRWITSPSTIIQIHISADPSYLSHEASPLSIDLHDLSLDTVMPSSKALINHCQVRVCVCVHVCVCECMFCGFRDWATPYPTAAKFD